MLTVYHGSSEIIEKPEFGKGKTYNDYGQGFYCTESLELAKEWACTENRDGYANKYELDLSELRVLHLSGENYSVLNWLSLLVENREFSASTPIARQGINYLKSEFAIDIRQFDVIIGYRADDSYFSFARAFVNNAISLNQLSRAMKLGKLGEQVVCKSRKAFGSLRFIAADIADNTIYYAKRKKRDEDARDAYLREAENNDIDGIFMRDIIREGIKNGDSRLR